MNTIVLSFLFVVLVGISPAYSATLFMWDRDPDPTVDHYEMYSCSSSPTCVPDPTKDPQFSANIPQTVTGINPSMALPTSTSARYAVVAVDAIGIKSTDSNVLPFRPQPITSPANLRLQ